MYLGGSRTNTPCRRRSRRGRGTLIRARAPEAVRLFLSWKYTCAGARSPPPHPPPPRRSAAGTGRPWGLRRGYLEQRDIVGALDHATPQRPEDGLQRALAVAYDGGRTIKAVDTSREDRQLPCTRARHITQDGPEEVLGECICFSRTQLSELATRGRDARRHWMIIAAKARGASYCKHNNQLASYNILAS